MCLDNFIAHESRHKPSQMIWAFLLLAARLMQKEMSSVSILSSPCSNSICMSWSQTKQDTKTQRVNIQCIIHEQIQNINVAIFNALCLDEIKTKKYKQGMLWCMTLWLITDSDRTWSQVHLKEITFQQKIDSERVGEDDMSKRAREEEETTRELHGHSSGVGWLDVKQEGTNRRVRTEAGLWRGSTLQSGLLHIEYHITWSRASKSCSLDSLAPACSYLPAKRGPTSYPSVLPTQPWFQSSKSPPSISPHTHSALSNYSKTHLWQKNGSDAGLLLASSELKTVRPFDANPFLTEKGPVLENTRTRETEIESKTLNEDLTVRKKERKTHNSFLLLPIVCRIQKSLVKIILIDKSCK